MRRLSRAIALILIASGTTPVGADVLWDNGLSFAQRMSHLSGKGQRRSVLDDFIVGGPARWSIQRVGIVFTWDRLDWGFGKDFEVTFYGDAGGQPDFDTLVATAENRVYSETLWNCTGICWGEIAVEFDPVVLTPGTYWADFHVVAPINGFQFISDTVHGSASWIDYEDLGGRQPSNFLFGNVDANFVLEGDVIPAPPAVALLTLAVLFITPRRHRRKGPP